MLTKNSFLGHLKKKVPVNEPTAVSCSLEQLINLRQHAASMALDNTKPSNSPMTGPYRTRLRGRGIEFSEVREYQPGDDIRHMDWRVTARTGIPHSKIYQEERERPVFFVVDYGPSMFFGTRVTFKSAIAAQATALLAWTAANYRDHIGALIFSGKQHTELRPKTGLRGVPPLLNALADVEKSPCTEADENDLRDALIRLRHVSRPGSLIFIVSDFLSFNEEAENYLSQLAPHNDIVALQIYDPLEVSLPSASQYTFTNGQERLLINAIDEQIQKNYDNLFKKRFDHLQQVCCRNKMSLLQLATDKNVVLTLKRNFAKNVSLIGEPV